MKNFLLRALVFLRLADAHDSPLSLTDIGTWIVLIKIAILRQPTLPDLAALLAMLLARAHKHYLGAGAVKNADALNGAVDQAKQAMTMAGEFITKQKQIEDRLTIVDNRTRPLNQRT